MNIKELIEKHLKDVELDGDAKATVTAILENVLGDVAKELQDLTEANKALRGLNQTLVESNNNESLETVKTTLLEKVKALTEENIFLREHAETIVNDKIDKVTNELLEAAQYRKAKSVIGAFLTEMSALNLGENDTVIKQRDETIGVLVEQARKLSSEVLTLKKSNDALIKQTLIESVANNLSDYKKETLMNLSNSLKDLPLSEFQAGLVEMVKLLNNKKDEPNTNNTEPKGAEPLNTVNKFDNVYKV